MIIKKYKAKLIAIEEPIKGVYTLTLASNKGRFRYGPGQFLHLAIDTDYDGVGQWPESRCFSMQTAPDEEYIKITYAVKGNFTKQMEKYLKNDSEVWLKLPYGDLFSQTHNKNHTVFISGGTGITPFLSLFTDTSFSVYNNPVLYAGFRTEDFDIYKPELEKALSLNASLKIKKVFQNREGILNVEQIFNENGISASYFISGPPMMIKNFKHFLLNHDVQEANILTDDWE